jgi:hypothetical protein
MSLWASVGSNPTTSVAHYGHETSFKYKTMMIRSLLATGIAAASMVAPAMAQVTSVSQLRDVQPTEWSYQAISNLVSRYGCIAGFPDGTFRPGEPATRAQLAALTNACLDRITEYQTEADAKLAAALRAEFASVNTRVDALELAAAQKAQGVNNYLGLGVLLNKQGVDGNGYTADRTISGGTLQARYAVKTFKNQNAVSLRPYLNAVAGPSGEIGTAGGGLVSYDWSISRAASGVSRANIYAGAGWQVPFVNNAEANYQSAIGNRGQVVLALGVEGRLTNSLVGFADLKFPTTNAGDSYGVTGAAYSPVFTTGLGFKF